MQRIDSDQLNYPYYAFDYHLTRQLTKPFEKLLDRLHNAVRLFGVPLADLVGRDAEGKVHPSSGWFPVLSAFYGRLLHNDPKKVLSRVSIRFRAGLPHWLIMNLGRFYMHGKVHKIEKQAPLSQGRPLIFTPNHGFVEDALCSIITAKEHAYLVFGTLPHFFNTTYGLAAYMNGSILINRKDKASKQALMEKAVAAMELGTNIIMYPEGTWNKSPNRLMLNYWPGVFRLAKRTNALIVPVVHLVEGKTIHSSRLAPFDPSAYADSDEAEALTKLRDLMSTELMELMHKYAKTTRKELLGSHPTMHRACEHIVRSQVETAGRYYDCEVEAGGADFRCRDTAAPHDVWRSIAELPVNARNVGAVLYAQQIMDEDYQHRF